MTLTESKLSFFVNSYRKTHYVTHMDYKFHYRKIPNVGKKDRRRDTMEYASKKAQMHSLRQLTFILH